MNIAGIQPDQPDVTSPTETFDALCRMCGVPNDRDARLDFQGFVLGFESLYNRGVPLDDECVEELRALAGLGEEEEVSMGKWNAFHRKWLEETSMGVHLAGKVESRRKLEESESERRRLEEEGAKREKEWAEALSKAKAEGAKQAGAAPSLLAAQAEAASKKRGAWFEARESAAAARRRRVPLARSRGVVVGDVVDRRLGGGARGDPPSHLDAAVRAALAARRARRRACQGAPPPRPARMRQGVQ